VSYGFDVDVLMVWLEPLRTDAPAAGGLCRRHAEALTVPRGWWLQDRRDDGSLFPTPPNTPVYRERRTRRQPPEDSRHPPVVVPLVAVDGTGRHGPWMPAFDTDSDVGGLLDAHTPLLARAFGGPAAVPQSEG
jgi:hypothetical protein